MHRLPIAIYALSLGLAACGSDNSTGPSPTPGDIDIVKGILKRVGKPDSLTVSWVNTDGGGAYGGTGVAHQIASDNGAFATSQPLGAGATYLVQLQAGTYGYHCAIHPNMVGTITVGP